MSRARPLRKSDQWVEIPLDGEYAKQVAAIARRERIRERARVRVVEERREQGLPDSTQLTMEDV